jgi:cell wall-associated NlpC family hydrolase
LAANPNSNDLASIAYSLVGKPYISMSNGPYGFDCSGLVQYVYAQKGISVSRSSSTQIYDGVGVPYEEAQPGDILSWGYSYGNVTHSAMYVGNGKMVHAANPSMGVIVSDVSYWLARSGTKLLSVRRIQ